jgi:hypothetical protein
MSTWGYFYHAKGTSTQRMELDSGSHVKPLDFQAATSPIISCMDPNGNGNGARPPTNGTNGAAPPPQKRTLSLHELAIFLDLLPRNDLSTTTCDKDGCHRGSNDSAKKDLIWTRCLNG